jgi:AcrR family transcriptional regulator
VKTIAEISGVSRKTFYYHFQDLAGLSIWVFRYELSVNLIKSCEPECLVFPAASIDDPYPELPYYVRQPSGIRSLDGSQFFRIICEYLQKNRLYYRRILEDDTNLCFMRYIKKLYRQAFYEDINFILGGRQQPTEVKRCLATYFSNAAVYPCFSTILYSNVDLRNLLPKELANINHDNLYETIERYFSRTVIKYKFV